ncbi:signal peptidase I [Candidatus Woesearchaeota archaeon]|jgi:signal peptidase I|nr:signal peptidase I [Candidatus Woesearchaeota archaeon]
MKKGMSLKNAKRIWKKVWYFIWEDDSWLSWAVNVILAFVLIKFIIYPILGLILSTSYPIVAVVSGSMEHDGNFDQWWESGAYCDSLSQNTITVCNQELHYSKYEITKEQFKEYRYKNGFNKGDIMLIYGSAPEKLKQGDVLVFEAGKSNPIIHRIVKVNEYSDSVESQITFTTKGDHNPTSSNFEKQISSDFVIGKAVFRIPYLGYIKIWFVEGLQKIGIIK